MSEADELIHALKLRLRRQGITYRELAGRLSLSEASVKRMFSKRQFSLDRLLEISQLAGYSLAELAAEADSERRRIRTLDIEQERELVADIRTLLVAVCVLNQWSISDIGQVYQITDAEIVARLATLDRLGLIVLLPGNRARLNVARDFDWQAHGPIRNFFRKQGLADFLDGDFAAEHEDLAFAHGMLTRSHADEMRKALRKLRARFAELHEESRGEPRDRRCGMGLLVAFREWELAAFTELRRRP